MLHEAIMWNQLKQGRLNGLDFDRQKVIGNYIVDFFCAERSVVLEVDGSSHDDRYEHDIRRDAYLGRLGLTVIRLSVDSVLNHLDDVIEFLKEHPLLAATLPEQQQ